NPNDTHPDWLGESYVGLGASMTPALTVDGPGGKYFKGDLYSTRGSVQTSGAFFLAAEWQCAQVGADQAGAESPMDAGVGKWRVSEDTNPIDDTKTVTLMLDAVEGTSRFGNK